MEATGTSRAKISIEDVILDETGEIHITGEKDEYLLPPEIEKEDFEKVIRENFRGQEMSVAIENNLISQVELNQINKEDRLNEYLQKFISLGLFILAVIFAVWLNDKLKDELGVFATFIAGFIILLSSISSIVMLGLFSLKLQNSHN